MGVTLFHLFLTIYSYFERLQKQKGKYYEIVYSDYRQQHPWGTTPEDEWQNSTRDYPDGLRGPDGYTRIPISALCHVTHNKEANFIRSSDETRQCYTFKPAAKLGKQYGDDRLPLGETYRHIERRIFSKVPHSQDDPVFPGYYCWWGLNTTEWYRGSLLSITRRPDVELAEFAAHPPKSRYGNNAFTIRFSELLLSYKRSRTDVQEARHNIYLRVGGTLRYKYEICYVVIVCLQQDHGFDDLDTIDRQDRPIIDHKGLVDRGKVNMDYQKTPEFKAKHIVSSMNYQSFSWEQVVFALYYPSEGFKLCCNKDEVIEQHIEHDFCISTQSGPGGRRLCPNVIH